MIIAVDFDGTIQTNKKAANIALIQYLITRQRNHDIVILWSCREGKNLSEAVQFCMKHGFHPNYVNRNAPEVIRRMGHDSRKIYADVYIDDKGMRL